MALARVSVKAARHSDRGALPSELLMWGIRHMTPFFRLGQRLPVQVGSKPYQDVAKKTVH